MLEFSNTSTGNNTQSWHEILFIVSNSLTCFLTVILALSFFLIVIIRSCLVVIADIDYKSKFCGAELRYFSEKHTLAKRSIRFLFFLHLNTLSFALIMGMSTFYDLYKDNVYLCIFQGLVIQFNAWNINLSMVTIGAWLLFEFILIKKQIFIDERTKGVLEIINLVILIVITLTATLIPLGFDKFGQVDYWCWINDKSWEFYCYYIWLWLILVIVFFVYFTSIIVLFSTFQDKFLNFMFQKADSKPLIFLLMWIEPTVRRTLEFFNVAQSIDWILAIFHACSINLFGFFTVLLFFFNVFFERYIFKLLVFLWRKYCLCKKPERTSDNVNVVNDEFEVNTISSTSFQEKLEKKALLNNKNSEKKYTF